VCGLGRDGHVARQTSHRISGVAYETRPANVHGCGRSRSERVDETRLLMLDSS